MALSDGMAVVKTNAMISTRLLRKYTKINEDLVVQETYEWIKGYFPKTLRVEEKSVINMLRFLDHPKAKAADPRQFFDNSLVEEIG